MATIRASFSVAPRYVDLGPELVVYCDEQGSSHPSDPQAFAVGILFGSSSTSLAPVADALARRDCRCTRRSHFHGSKDCGRCQELLATTIRESFGDLFFTSCRWRKEESERKVADLHAHALALAMPFWNPRHGIRRVRLRIAAIERPAFSFFERWFEEELEVRLKTAAHLRGFPTVFPEVLVEEVSGEDPGVQLVDHLLWAERRSSTHGGDAFARTGILPRVETDQDVPYTSGEYAAGEALPMLRATRPLPGLLASLDRTTAFGLLMFAEHVVHHTARVRPASVRHLEGHVLPTAARTRGKEEISDADWLGICRAFLLLADTVPVYDVADAEAAQAVTDAASLVSQMYLQRDPAFVPLADRWRDARAALVREGRAEALFE
jgi:hypothetical protein